MRMIEKIMRSMRDTGLLDGMSDEDCDTLATASLEGMRSATNAMYHAGQSMTFDQTATINDIYRAMIYAALNE